MSGITIVAALVRCSADLLLCNDIDTSALYFTDVAECTSRLPALIDQVQRVGAKGTVVMGRCRFQPDRTPVERERMLKPSGALKGDVLPSDGSFVRALAIGAVLPHPHQALRISLPALDVDVGRPRDHL